jgi:UDP-N-acetylmuramyl pentapeptide phosphotransferase/UDP-N-acetylglucosamine-1-phosphate transferase
MENLYSILAFTSDWSELSSNQILITLLLAFIFAALTIFLSIPPTIHFCKKYNLLDVANAQRKTHNGRIPILGGFNHFIALFIPFSILATSNCISSFTYVFLSMFILLIIGIWDDIRSINPWIKLIAQLIAAILVVIFGEIYITSLFGLFGVYDISLSTSYAISFFLILTIINGINLLDGINGLSTSLVGMLSIFFFTWFYMVDRHSLSLFSIILIGSTLSFLWYNWSPAKIFLGDSGAMVLGLSLSILTISFLQIDHELLLTNSSFAIFHAPKIVIASLLLPLIDTSRVFLLRVWNGKSPLLADRNHIHHRFIDAGYSDTNTTLILLSVQLGLILIALSTSHLSYFSSFLLFSGTLLIILIWFWHATSNQKDSVFSS